MTQTQDAPSAIDVANATSTPSVHAAIASVIAAAARRGVAQDSVNTDQRYRYRSIYALPSHLSPHIGAAGLTILPADLEVTEGTKPTKSGGTMHIVTMRVRWLITGPAGDTITVPTIGTGSDVSDKAMAKAMTAAHKSLLTVMFLVPFAEPDGDERTPDIDHAPPPADPAASIKLELWRRLHNSGLEAEAARDLVAGELAQLDATPEAATLAQWEQVSANLLRGDGPADPAATSEDRAPSEKQLGYLALLLSRFGITETAERLYYVGVLAGRDNLESSKDLTRAEVAGLLDLLGNVLNAAGGRKPSYADVEVAATRARLEEIVTAGAAEQGGEPA